MQLRHEQLSSHLQKTLAPIYLVSGDVPLLIQEACDAIRLTAFNQGYLERKTFHIETGFSWQELLNTADNFSLFSEKQLLELRIPNNSLGEGGGKVLQAYTERIPADKILMISMGKLEAAAQRTAWFKAVMNAGVVVQIWPIERTQLPRWIAERLAKAKLKIEPVGVQLLVDYAEGNLLAAKQEIEKLQLIFGEDKTLTAEDIAQAINDSARFDVFIFIDVALQGDRKRLLRVLNGLQAEGIEPILILWAITRELRSLVIQAQAVAKNISIEKVLQEHRVWEKRKPLVRAALQRHTVQQLQEMLIQASVIDRMIKGLEPGNVWDALIDLGLAITGVR